MKEQKPKPIPWPFPQWKDGKMIKVKPVSKKERLAELPPAPL